MQIVWFSEIKWDYLKTRKQQIISRKPADVQLLFLEPFVKNRRNVFRLRTEGDIFCATVPFIKSAPAFPWRPVLDRQAARRTVDFMTRLRIQGLIRHLGFGPSQVGFIISNIYAADIALSLRKRFLLYDCNDDHASFPGMRSWTRAYFYKTSRRADAVFASSKVLFDKVCDVRGAPADVDFLGNGVDYAHFQDGGWPAAPLEPGEKPRVGYIGALAPWVDFDALADLADRHPEWEVVLVGPVLQGADGPLAVLTRRANVFHLPAVSYDRVPGILAQFTLGLIPFRYNELTRGVNPNKLYEYLAAGLPVVTTRFSPEVQSFPEVVKAANPGEDFSRACEETIAALADGTRGAEMAETARRIAKQNDWNVIADHFWKKVAEMAAEG